ncbi:type II toxin-antitoxin system RelE/ParE family toxin [Bacteroides sp.]|uniref:type II toxin-antitoxin system RelE/ParE family toxin n=1 Tax=Bacteroides sp. TaxID=29523 RepID=UPI002624F4BE|nr:type II toxin-antitoxin system RelE/ParE family toxin [Bacteroides sp.]MDD3040668.1 type II toxin-antitoxin system RelE/ParE family toxin [Bacteroides sp.]
MTKVILSQAADADLEDIFDFTLEKFGLDQAVSYVSGFDNTFEIISRNPEIGRERKEIREELHSLAKDKHVIFYRILSDHIRIVRILHRSMDFVQHLSL